MSFEQKLLLKKQIKSQLEKLKKELTCQVCLSIFTDPQTLSCSHSYCKPCIKNLLQASKQKGKFSCPQCRRLTSRREANHEDVMLSNLVSKLQEFWNLMPAEIGCEALTQNTQWYNNYTVPKHMRASQVCIKHNNKSNTNNNSDNESVDSHGSNIENESDIHNINMSISPPQSDRKVRFNSKEEVHDIDEPIEENDTNKEPLYLEEEFHSMSQNRVNRVRRSSRECSVVDGNNNMDMDIDEVGDEEEFNSNVEFNSGGNDIGEDKEMLELDGEQLDYTLDIGGIGNDNMDDGNDVLSDLNPTMSMAMITDFNDDENSNEYDNQMGNDKDMESGNGNDNEMKNNNENDKVMVNSSNENENNNDIIEVEDDNERNSNNNKDFMEKNNSNSSFEILNGNNDQNTNNYMNTNENGNSLELINNINDNNGSEDNINSNNNSEDIGPKDNGNNSINEMEIIDIQSPINNPKPIPKVRINPLPKPPSKPLSPKAIKTKPIKPIAPIKSLSVSTRSRRKIKKIKKTKAQTSHLLQSKTYMSQQLSQIVLSDDENENEHENTTQNTNETTDNKMDIDNNEDIDMNNNSSIQTPIVKKKYKSKRSKKKKLSVKKKNKKQSNLAKLESSGGLIRKDFVEGEFCSVCCEDVDDIGIYCDGCNVFVHMGCYGIIKKPKKKEQWYCDACKRDLSLKLDNIISCCICNTSIDGAYKIVKQTNVYTNHWAHTSCALWITGVNFINKDILSPISIDDIDKDRYKLKCIFCKKKGGACLQCELCTHSFHVPCAQRGTAMLELREDGDRVYFHSFCPLHTDEESRNSVPDNNHDHPIYPRKNSKKRKREDDIENNNNKSNSKRKKRSSKKRKKSNSNNNDSDNTDNNGYNMNVNINTQKKFQSPDVRKRKLSDLQPVIICSKLSEDQMDDWENFKTKFGGIARFRNTYHPDVTHVITSATVKRDKRMLSARTIKYLKGVIAGSWILCFDWIDECLNKNTLVTENKYEVLGDKDGKGACKRSRESREKNKNDNGLFSNIVCVIGSEFPFVGLCDDLRSMFRMGGAKIHKMFPYHWLKDINKYKKEELKGKSMVFVYDIEQNEMNDRQVEFCEKFGVLCIGYKDVFNAISNYKRINEFICHE